MSEALLEVRGLRVEIPTRRGLLVPVDGVSLRIGRGEVLGLVGESGAGKSLTGAAIIGLLDPPCRIAAGEILLEGRRIDGLPDGALRRVRGKEVGVVFQDPLASLDPLQRVGDQIGETLRTHLPLSRAAARRRALELLGEVGIPAAAERLDNYPHQLSGGMRQRVVVALALCAGPKLLIADECTTALDVSVQAQIIALLDRLRRERGMAILLVTHDMGVVAEIADRVAVMYAGRVVEIGAVDEVVLRPRHPYARGLMGSVLAVDTAAGPLAQIPGAMPRLGEAEGGCAFHPRCREAFERCRLERPELAPAGGARVACWVHAGPLSFTDRDHVA
jgi:peptide/nickel transport system ATP-binding protein